MHCKDHPTYHVIRSPRNSSKDCEVCWQLWYDANDPEKLEKRRKLQEDIVRNRGRIAEIFKKS